MEENAGFSQCTGMLSGDAHLNTQGQGISLTWRDVNGKDTKMQEGLNCSGISASPGNPLQLQDERSRCIAGWDTPVGDKQ